MELKISTPDDPRSLHVHYLTSTKPQPVYIELDPSADPPTLSLDYDETSGDIPFSVWHGRIRRYILPGVLTRGGMDQLIADIIPLAERVVNGYSERWDGHNYVGHLDEDATEAEVEIFDLIYDIDPDDMLPVINAVDWLPEEVFAQDLSSVFSDLASISSSYEIEALAHKLINEAWEVAGIHIDTSDMIDTLTRRGKR